jgi:hypothetical protein
MAEHKHGCAVVMEHHKVVGVFTTVDALSLLTVMLGESKDNTALGRALTRYAGSLTDKHK